MIKECYCGSPYKETVQSIVNKYDDREITINNVPVAICGNGHVRIPRWASVRVNEQIKVCFSSDKNETDFH